MPGRLLRTRSNFCSCCDNGGDPRCWKTVALTLAQITPNSAISCCVWRGAVLATGEMIYLTLSELFDIIYVNQTLEVTMVGNLQVRNLDDDLIVRLKRRAARHGRSTESEHREILRQALSAEVEPSFDELAAKLREMTKGRQQTPSEELQREGREER